MKRFLAAALTLAAVMCFASASWAAWSGPATFAVKRAVWRRSIAAASNGGAVDSLVFSADGSSNATRDTTAWLDQSQVAPWSPSFASVGDSTLWMSLTISPLASYNGTALGTAADSLYAYVQYTNNINDGPQATAPTNLVEILATEAGTNNAFEFPITWARAAVGGAQKFRFVRWIVRGDVNGWWEGRYTFARSLSPSSE